MTKKTAMHLFTAVFFIFYGFFFARCPRLTYRRWLKCVELSDEVAYAEQAVGNSYIWTSPDLICLH